eukprot:1767155-Pyramimonas_sp.AAC.1
MEHVDFVHLLYILGGEKECPSSESEAGPTRLFKEAGVFTTFVMLGYWRFRVWRGSHQMRRPNDEHVTAPVEGTIDA